MFGVYAKDEDAARMTAFGLQALQHRGQESAGIAVGDGETILVGKELGLVTQAFNESSLAALEGFVAVGHTRYSSSKASSSWDASQPHISAIGETPIALAHNGALLNTNTIKARLIDEGVSFRAGTDSEVAAKVIGHITKQTNHLRAGIRGAMELFEGAYAMVLASPDALYAFRGPYGVRPLCIGELSEGRGWVVSSETCGLDIVGARYLRDVEPGEILRFNENGLSSWQGIKPRRHAACAFEYVYFARPDSIIDGQSVYQARRDMGRILARESSVDADLVLGVPDSGVPAAVGYAQESGLPYCDGIVKNRYVGRTFIQPTQEMRQLGIRVKLNPIEPVISGKRLVVIDDSIVRGNTSKQLVQMLRGAGATEVHLRIVSPEVLWPCFYGVDTDTQDQLIAANLTIDEMCEWIGCDSLAFVSLQGLRDSISIRHEGLCLACFDGKYPIEIPPAAREKSFLPEGVLKKGQERWL